MQVHLITIKICIIRSTHTFIKPESRKQQQILGVCYISVPIKQMKQLFIRIQNFCFSVLTKENNFTFTSLCLVERASFLNTLFLFQLDTLLFFPFLHSQFYNFLYMFRTGWSIIRRIKLHVQPLAPFPHSLLSRAWPLVLTDWCFYNIGDGHKF